MALKDLLVHVDHSADGILRLRLAVDLAVRHGARLTALHARQHSILQQHRLKSGELGLVGAVEAAAISQSVEDEIEADAVLLSGLLEELRDRHGLDVVWSSITGQASKLVVQHSRYADLTIVGQGPSVEDDLPDNYSFAEAVLFDSGRPVVIVPAGLSQSTLGNRIAVGWNGSRPAARTLSDAVALIERADETIVMTADTARGKAAGSPPVEAIMANLSRHTAHVRLATLETGDRSIGDLLQAEALTAGADLLVVGAYGHPRLWERLLGGVTHDLLTRMRLPTLMSH